MEPLRMLLHPRMIGRALKREVEGDLQAQAPGPPHEHVEVLDRPEVRVDRVVTALGRADRPGHPHVVGGRRQGVVGALAEGAADGVDRREVDDVEAHLRDGGQPLGRRTERAVHRPVHAAALRTREELVPGTEQRPLPLHQQRQRLRRREQFTQRMPRENLVHLGSERRGEPGRGGAPGVAQGVGGGEDHLPPALALRYSGGRPLVQARALREDEFGVDPGRDLDPGVTAPGGDRIAPGLDGVRPAAGGGRGHGGAPAVGAGGEFAHGGPGAAAALRIREDDIGGDRVMAFAEDRGGDLELLTDDRFGRAAPVVDERTDVEDGDASDAGGGARGGCLRGGWTGVAPAYGG
ncbi:hypothetical protein Save01_04251 [Streptomyces avermitilis]